MNIPLLQSMPTSFAEKPLNENDVHRDPFTEFRNRFNDAVEAGVPETNAMVLSTASRDGGVSARFVLLRSLDDRGFVFFTNYESRKSADLAENPSAHLLFYWREVGLQIRIEGSVEKVSVQESKDYFDSRARESRIGAWASPQSRVIDGRETLERAVQELGDRFADGDVPLPPFWGGFRLVPSCFEFWQGRESRLHDRLRYTVSGADAAWVIERLAP
ncbi:MAG: pyridoxamine 5'-phosphate oxidase [Candidatus Kapaibacterium sp.]